MEENREEMIIPEMPEESIESKIAGHQAQIDQMYRMIDENHRQIELGDDVEGRTKMIQTLTDCIENEKREIAELEKQRSEEEISEQ